VILVDRVDITPVLRRRGLTLVPHPDTLHQELRGVGEMLSSNNYSGKTICSVYNIGGAVLGYYLRHAPNRGFRL
jgi:hypothetical protein